MKRIVAIGSVLVIALTGLSGCSSGSSAKDRAAQKAADAAAISNIEAIIHRSQGAKDIDSFMTPFADDAVFTLGGKTITGKEEIRKFALTTPVFKPENRWVVQTPAYKIRTSTDGSRGTLYFECHYIDVDQKVVRASISVDVKVSKVKGQWTLTNVVAAPAVLS
jgi:hypothetical protein